MLFLLLVFFHCFKRLCIYVMVSDGEIVGNMFKENLDSVQSFDIFCCFEKQHIFPTCSYHFPTKVAAFLLGFPPSLPPNLPQGCCYFWAAEVRSSKKTASLEGLRVETTKKAAILEQQNMSIKETCPPKVVFFLYCMYW